MDVPVLISGTSISELFYHVDVGVVVVVGTSISSELFDHGVVVVGSSKFSATCAHHSSYRLISTTTTTRSISPVIYCPVVARARVKFVAEGKKHKQEQ